MIIKEGNIDSTVQNLIYIGKTDKKQKITHGKTYRVFFVQKALGEAAERYGYFTMANDIGEESVYAIRFEQMLTERELRMKKLEILTYPEEKLSTKRKILDFIVKWFGK